MSETCLRFPYRTITRMWTCVAVAFGIALGIGALEVRRVAKPAFPPRPESQPAYVQRDKAAESLLENQNTLWVYQFAGGLPKCWVELDSEGHKHTLGPCISTLHLRFIGDDQADCSVWESVEGYVALFGPTSEEQKYRMVCEVTKVDYPQNMKQESRPAGLRNIVKVRLPNLLPLRPEGKVLSGRTHINDGTKPQVIPVAEDKELNFLIRETVSGKSCIFQLKLRFLTTEEIVAKK